MINNNKKRLVAPTMWFITLVLGVLMPISALNAQQAAVNCLDPVDKWYDCWQRFSIVDKYVKDWCSKASPSPVKGQTESARDKCVNFLFKGVNLSPPGIASSERCNDLQGIAENKNCYVFLRTGGAFYAQVKALGNECNGYADLDVECARDFQEQYLISKGWYNPDASTGLSGDIDQTSPDETPFIKRITAYIRWLIVGIGILAVFGFVIAGIQYSAAQDNPQAVAAAKTRINNIVIGIIIYFVMFAALQWLIPGGVF